MPFVRGVIFGFDLGGVQVEGQRIGVHEDRRRAAVAHRVGGGDIGQGRDDHLVAGLNTQRHQRQVQRRRAVVAGHGVAHAAIGCEGCFEVADEMPD